MRWCIDITMRRRIVPAMDTQQIIAALRKEFGLSQTEIATRLKIPQPRISRWEGGEAPPAADDALKLARLLDELRSAKSGEAAA